MVREWSAGRVGDDSAVRCTDGVGSAEGSGGGSDGFVGGADDLSGGGAIDGARRNGWRLRMIGDRGV